LDEAKAFVQNAIRRMERGVGMAKFILGLLVGLVIGLVSSPYFSRGELNDLSVKARAELGRHVPINN
jgi:preprotein translocase subunit SecF